MNDYKATVLQLLADIGGGDPPANGPVLSDAQFRSEVLRLLSAMSGGGGGSGGGALVVTATYDSEAGVYTLDKTAGEIYAACPFVAAVEEDYGVAVYQLRAYFFSNDEGYRFEFVGTDSLSFIAASADDYPTEDIGGGQV